MTKNTYTPSFVTHEFGDKDAWQCSCGNEPNDHGFYPCDESGKIVEPDNKWKGLYYCRKCSFVFHMDEVKDPNIVDLSIMSRTQRYELATTIIRQICSEWFEAEDEEEWREKNVEYYEASMSFDELASDVAAVSFKGD